MAKLAVSSMEVQSKNSVANYADRHPQCTRRQALCQ